MLPRETTVHYFLSASDIIDQETREPPDAPETVLAFRMTGAAAHDDEGSPHFVAEGEGEAGGGAGGGGGGGEPGGGTPCQVAISYPRHGDTLDPREDDFDDGVAGLQTPVRGTTDAPDGTPATLVISGGERHEAAVVEGLMEFPSANLPVGEVTLELRVAAPTACTAKSSVGVLDDQGRPECDQDADCGDSAACFRGNCVGLTACDTLDDCPAGMLCHQSACIRPQELPSDACDEDEDCAPGLLCSFELCAPESCRDGEDCLADERCFLGECLTEDLPAPDTCQDDEDCGDDNGQCLAGLCVPRQCFDDEDCGDGDSCFSGFCIGFNPPVGACDSDEDCPGGQQCFLNEVCLPGFLPLPDSCRSADECDGGPDENVCLFGACIRADCQVKADCADGQDCRFGFCMPEDLPPPLPGTCGAGRPDCPDGSSCLLSICIPDALPIPRPCNPDGTCASDRQQCLFGLICFGF